MTNCTHYYYCLYIAYIIHWLLFNNRLLVIPLDIDDILCNIEQYNLKLYKKAYP